MATRYDNVIVFGPTGAVGSAVALEARKRGAKVWLAMRDPTKTIDGIGSEDELDDKHVRMKADLTDPETVKQAVQKSGAKAAFVYLIFGPGGIKPALQAMQEAGIEYVVFLSSFTIKKGADVREVPPEALIPYAHAQVEVALEDLGIAHAALRPASFASNPFKMSMEGHKTPAEVYVYSEGKRTVDNIVPNDIGRVGGAVLVDRPSSSSKEVIYLYGPNLSTELETGNTIKSLSSKEVKVVQQSPKEWEERMLAKGFPPPLVKYLAKVSTEHTTRSEYYSDSMAQEGAANIKKYSGYEPTSFEDFVKSQEIKSV